MRVRVAVDALGGDREPEEIVAGALAAAAHDVRPIIYGPADLDTHGLDHVVTQGMVEMDDKPADAVRNKQDSSLVRAVRAVGDGHADAVVSAGNTGAVLAASLLHVRRLPGVFRPGIAVVIPTDHGPCVLIDAGATADARPEHLLQFGHMGSIFAQEVLGIERPRVSLLSIGEEPEKGNQLTLEAHALLAASSLRFDRQRGGARAARGRGGRDRLRRIHRQRCPQDARGHRPQPAHRAPCRRSWRRPEARLGGFLIRPAAARLRTRLDPETTGGGYLLGLRGLVVIAHGSSSRFAIENAVRMAARGIDHDVVGRMREALPERVVESARSSNPSGTTRG